MCRPRAPHFAHTTFVANGTACASKIIEGREGASSGLILCATSNRMRRPFRRYSWVECPGISGAAGLWFPFGRSRDNPLLAPASAGGANFILRPGDSEMTGGESAARVWLSGYSHVSLGGPPDLT